MTVGTGFYGRSSLVENLEPKHFVQWTRLAYNSDPSETFGNFSGLVPWESPVGPVPAYPVASNVAPGTAEVASARWAPAHLRAPAPAAGMAEGATPLRGGTPAHLTSGSAPVFGQESGGGLGPD